MEFFELLAAMKARAPVMTRIKEPSYEVLIVGTVAGVGYRFDKDSKVVAQAEIKDRSSNSITVVACENVEKLWQD